MSQLKISLVCCDDTPEKHSQIVETVQDSDAVHALVFETVEQHLDADVAKDLHNAAHHPEHGAVTYFQQVNEGGFSVFTGAPDDLKETFFGAGSLVAFIDDEGPGHGCRVGPEGVKRTMRILKEHLKVR